MQNHIKRINQSQVKLKIAPPLFLFCRNWKSQNQILVFAIILFLTIFSIIYVLSYLVLSLTIQELQNNSNLIFQQEKSKQIQRYSQLQLRITQNYFQSGTSELQRLNEIFHLTQRGINTVQPSDCIFNFNESDPYQRSCQFCYGFCNLTDQTDPADYESMFNYSSMLTEYAALLDLDRQTYFTGLTQDQYFSTYLSTVKEGFQSHKRQWYLDHMAQMSTGNELIVSAPYISQLNQIHVAQTHNLTNLNNEFIGIIAKDGDFSNMPHFNTSQIIPTIVNYNGDLVISKQYETEKNVVKFYQTNLTGQNQEDWNSIINLNLSKNEIYSIKLYNSLYEQEMLFSIIDMKSPPFFIILQLHFSYFSYVDDMKYNKDELDLFAKFYEFQYSFSIISIEVSSVIGVILLTMQFILISLITRNLSNLTQMTYQNIQAQGSQQHYNFTKINTFGNQTIKDLFKAYNSLVINITATGSQRRNLDCKYLELINYPLQHRKIDKSLFKYKELMRNQLQKIRNTCYHLQKIQQILCSSIKELYQNKQ